MSTEEDVFAELLSANQMRLFGYVMGLVRNAADAQDILQQTAITAWAHFSEFNAAEASSSEYDAKSQTDFFRWTSTIARHETLNFKKIRRRSRVYFDQELMEKLGETMCDITRGGTDDRTDALTRCLKKLPAADSKLLECRYGLGLGSLQISELLDRSQASVCNSLRRIRDKLLRCVHDSLSHGEVR